MKTFLLRRKIDLSLLTNGFHIPLEFHKLVYALCGKLHRGENRTITIQIGSDLFKAKLYNINFDQSRYPTHPDLLQIRYTAKSPIAKKLQAIFCREYEYLQKERIIIGPRKQLCLPSEYASEFIFYGTELKDFFIIDCEEISDKELTIEEIRSFSEEEFELGFIKKDPTASITEINRIQRIRQLDRSISDSLKLLYEYRCQMTGENVGEDFGISCVEAHHIIPFTQSLNNDTSNIIILSPNYHRIIHKANPIFNRELLAYEYPNGLIEKVKLDMHLRISR